MEEELVMGYEGKRCILKVGHHGHSNLVLSIQRFFNTAMLEKYDPPKGTEHT